MFAEAQIVTRQEYDTDFDDLAMRLCELYRHDVFPPLLPTLDEENAIASEPQGRNDTVFARKWSTFCDTVVFPAIDSVPETDMHLRSRLALTGSMEGPDVGNIVQFSELGKIVLSPDIKLVPLEARLSRLSKWVKRRKSLVK